jgi:uroporphyrinogen-III synthase
MPTVLLTRPRQRLHSDDTLHQVLRARNVGIIELPMIAFNFPRDLSTLDATLVQLASGGFDFVVLSSPTAVEFFDERIQELGIAKQIKAVAKFGAVGNATSAMLTLLGYNVSMPVPTNAGSRELSALLASFELSGKRILLLRSQIGLDHLNEALQSMGASTEVVTLYETSGPTLRDATHLVMALEGEERPDVVAFFSPSSVSYFVKTLAEMSSNLLHELPVLACVGETTAKSVEDLLRRRPEIVARKSDQASLVEDILIYLESKMLGIH